MKDLPQVVFVTVCAVVSVGIVLLLVFFSGKIDVAQDCHAMGMTKIGGTVFECKAKEEGK
jgi:hypothetical protein